MFYILHSVASVRQARGSSKTSFYSGGWQNRVVTGSLRNHESEMEASKIRRQVFEHSEGINHSIVVYPFP